LAPRVLGALQVEAEGSETHRASPITARDRAFRAASYYRAADFFLHGTPSDPRIASTWVSATAQFDQAIAQLTPAGERLTIQADFPAIVYGGRVGCLSLAHRSVRTDGRRRVGLVH
jgi:hypothetical protein